MGQHAHKVVDHDVGHGEVAALAGYIGELTSELAQLAERERMKTLAFFLNIARAEAELFALNYRVGLSDPNERIEAPRTSPDADANASVIVPLRDR